ncbi:MAG: TetR/AcrR family transcriptional regulator [Microbacteriaceae bacterium]
MAKEPQQQRSVERRAAIVAATAKIMVLEGAGAVSARRIAREAGVPVAAITYYFDSLAQILGEALINGLEQRNAELVSTMRAAVLQKASRGEALVALAEVLAHRDPHKVALRYELYGMASRSNELAESIRAASGLIYRGIESATALMGASAAVTASFEVLLEGFATASLTAPLSREAEVARTVDAMRRFVFSDLPPGMTMAEWDALPLITPT